MKTIKEVMTPELVSISINSKMAEAAELMMKHRIRHLPVKNENGEVVGILSSKDISIYDRFRRSDVGFFMNSPVLSIEQSATVKTAALKLLENKISCLMVCDSSENVVGIITTDDLLWYLVEKIDHEPKSRLESLAGSRVAEAFGQVANRLSNIGI